MPAELLSVFWMVVIAHLLAVMSPGPDFLITLRHATRYSHKAGIYTAAGIATGVVVHVSYAAAGVSWVVSRFPAIFGAIKIGGGLYLIYLGISVLRDHGERSGVEDDTDAAREIGIWRAWRAGFLTNVLNPKASLFFLGLFSLFYKARPPVGLVVLTGGVLVLNTFLWFVLVSLLLTRPPLLSRFRQYEALIQKGIGVLFVGLGVYLLGS